MGSRTKGTVPFVLLPIHLYYLYESKKEIFYRKFRESITIEELKKNSIVNFTYVPEQIANLFYNEVTNRLFLPSIRLGFSAPYR